MSRAFPSLTPRFGIAIPGPMDSHHGIDAPSITVNNLPGDDNSRGTATPSRSAVISCSPSGHVDTRSRTQQRPAEYGVCGAQESGAYSTVGSGHLHDLKHMHWSRQREAHSSVLTNRTRCTRRDACTLSNNMPAMILQLLKDVTRDSHLALERQMPLLDPALRPETYRHMVQQLFTYHRPLEAALLSSPGFAELGIAYAERAKTVRLARDLEASGLSIRDIEQLCDCESLPPLAHPSHIFGCLYVLEGATLGGQIVARHLLASLGLTADSGASYFSGYGVDTGPRWKAFCGLLTAYAARTDDQDDIVAGANATYATLSAWMRADDDTPRSSAHARADTHTALA